MLMATWFDRPLSVAGRLFVRENGAIAEKLVNVDRDLLVIPSVAIHHEPECQRRHEVSGQHRHRSPVQRRGPRHRHPAPGRGGRRRPSGGRAGTGPVPLLPRLRHGAGRPRRVHPLPPSWATWPASGAAQRASSPPATAAACRCCASSTTRRWAPPPSRARPPTFLRDTLRRISLALGQDEEAFRPPWPAAFWYPPTMPTPSTPHPEYADRGNCPP